MSHKAEDETSPSHGYSTNTREFVSGEYRDREKYPLNHGDIENLKHYRDRMAGILSELDLERELLFLEDAVRYGFTDVVKALYHFFRNQNIRAAFLAEYPRSEAIDIVRALNWKIKTYSIYGKSDGAEELSIIDFVPNPNSKSPEDEFFDNLENQEQSEQFEWVKSMYIRFIKHEFPESTEYHTYIMGKSSAELAGELQVYNLDDAENKGKHLKGSPLFTEYCKKAQRSENLEGHHTQFAIKIRRFLTNIKV